MFNRGLAYLGQGVFYLAFATLIGVFANGPAYTHFPPDRAQIKISFSHGGKHKGGCHKRTRAELAALAPNMRRPTSCPRERVPLYFELNMDGKELLAVSLPPSGLFKDGQARIYKLLKVKPGRHVLVLRLRDSERTEGFDYESTEVVTLKPLQNLVIDFRPVAGVFVVL